MPRPAKLYVGVVSVSGVLVLAWALLHWNAPVLGSSLLYLASALIAAGLKFRLPGIEGSYSLGYLFALVGVVHFNFPETVVTCCAAALIQTIWRAQRRPAPIQVLFNVANLALSVGFCFLLREAAWRGGAHSYGPAIFSVVTCLFFVANTTLVSGVLALLQGKPLRVMCRQWYFWSFPYYLVGAAVVGLLPLSGGSVRLEAWLLLLPLLYLLHFFYGLSFRSGGNAPDVPGAARMTGAARFYLTGVITWGLLLLALALVHWQSAAPGRFLATLVAAVWLSILKVRLPGMTGTLSLNFVLLLTAIADLSLSETIVLAASVAPVQCLWRPKLRPQAIQVIFSTASLVLSAAVAQVVCRFALALSSLPVSLLIATVVLYGMNTLLVAVALSAVENKPLTHLWRECYFWCFAYYLVGAGAAGLMTATARDAGWPVSLLILPLMALVYASYQLHVGAATQKQPAAG